MNYLVLMTVSGSLLFLGYLCWERLGRSFLTQGAKYKALIMVLLAYTVPWVWLKRVYSDISVLVLQEVQSIDGMSVKLADIYAQAEAYKTQDYRTLLWIAGVWLVGTLLFLVAKICIYFRHKRKLRSAAEKCRDEISEKMMARLKGKFRCKRKTEIIQVPGSITMTLGAIKPVIFLQEDYTGEELDFILRHEMTHIARRDLLIKLLLELVCCFHWFNPLIYILKSRVEFVCETSCDERVLKECTKEERGAYAKLIVRSSVEGKRKVTLGSAFGCNREKVQERVNLIMETNEIKRRGKVITAGCFALMLFADSLTALAYPAVHHVEKATVEAAEKAVAGDIFWGGGEAVDAEAESDEPEFPIFFEEQFIDEEGNVYPVESVSPQMICFSHNIVSGYYSVHYKNDDGGCTIDIYESTRCTKCNTIWVEKLHHINIFPQCPH